MLQIITDQNELREYLSAAINESFQNVSVTVQPPPEIINRKTLMQRLALSEPSIIRWQKKGKIPFLQIGSAVRYDWVKVVEALEGRGKGCR